MKKSFAIIISMLITLFIFINFYPSKTPYLEEVFVKRIIDGDTLVSSDDRTFRLANVNSPEKGKFGYELSYNFLLDFVNKTVEVNSISLDNRGEREVARIYFGDRYLNLEIVKKGLAPKAWVEQDELSIFSQAEKEAVEKERGIWEESEYFGCLDVSLDKELEELRIINNCSEFKIKGSTVKDESRKYLTIEEDLDELTIKSGEAFNSKNKNSIYWTKENIWNNDRDTIYLFDQKNKIIFYQQYGY